MKNRTAIVSGGFDPIHIGHIRMIKEAARYAKVTVILNSDEWLKRKKGYVFMPWKERAEIISEIKGVFNVHKALDDDDTVKQSLILYKPTYFINGGDRKEGKIPEEKLCHELGITVMFGIGGGKIQSSSALAKTSRVIEKRPWGNFELLKKGDNCWVKVLTIHPKQSISLQQHKHRLEIWTCVSGIGQADIGSSTANMKSSTMLQGHSLKIDVGDIHKISNNADSDLVIIETAYGTMNENDIVRLQDQYNRK